MDGKDILLDVTNHPLSIGQAPFFFQAFTDIRKIIELAGPGLGPYIIPPTIPACRSCGSSPQKVAQAALEESGRPLQVVTA